MRLRHAVLKRSKEGVSSIVQSGMLEGKSPAEVEQLMLQSQLFFWNRCARLGAYVRTSALLTCV
jgi:hypothetical protein